MDTKIQELTDKIYREGVEKGNEEAERIIAAANEKKDAILRDAEVKARQIVEDASKQADELKKHTEAELRLFASQAVEALKSEVTNLVTGRIASDNVRAAATDPDFMRQTILEIAKSWAAGENIDIQTTDAKGLTDYFASNAKYLLDKGVQITQVNGKAAAFTLSPADGSYKITFREDEFIAYFKEFLRPQLIEMLF